MARSSKSGARFGLAVVAGVVVVLLLGWVAANVVGGSDVAPPKWSEADLPPLPADADNAWLVIGDYERGEELDIAVSELSGSFDIETATAESLWTDIGPEQLRALHDMMASEAGRESLARLESLRHRPHFVARCGLVDDCPFFNWHHLHEVAVYRVIELELDGAEPEAIALVGDLVRLDGEHLRTADSWLSFAIAKHNLSHALAVADALALRSTDGGFDELAVEVEALQLDPVDLGVVVIGEYLMILEALEMVGADTDAEQGRLEGPSWLYNHAMTRRDVDARFTARYAAAAAGDYRGAIGIGEVSPKESVGWWLRNSTGKSIIDVMTLPLESLAADISEDLDAMETRRRQFLARPALRRTLTD